MNKKRLAIFQMYDKDGIVDEYILFLLKELSSVTNRLIVVSNGKIKFKYIKYIKKYADEIYMRKDLGGDAGAYKDTLNKFLGWDKVYTYDELILSNDTYFGPFEHFEKIFKKMQASKLDFWGITKMEESTNKHFGYIPKHLQAYFIVVRNKLLHSSIFKKFWEKNNIGKSNIYKDAVSNFEHAFTLNFETAGYKWDAYVNMDIYDSIIKEKNFPQYFFVVEN